MFCVSCGKAYEPHHKFCNQCGQPLTELSSTSPERTNVVEAVIPKPPSPDQASNPPVELQSLRATSEDHQLKGLRGWLICVGFGLLVGLFYFPYQIYGDVKLFNDGTVQFLSDPSSTMYIPGYSGVLRLESIGLIGLLGANVCLIGLFFSRSTVFPRYYSIFMLAIVLFFILDYGMLASVSASVPEAARKRVEDATSGQGPLIVQSLISSLLWVSYMLKSRRVKATFVN